MTVVAPTKSEQVPVAIPGPAGRSQLVGAGGLVALPLGGLVLAIALFWNHGIGWLDLGLAVGMYVFTGLGISIGFHRMFSHRSFVPARWLKVTLAIAGSMALEGSVTSWVSLHRRHHVYTDQPGDPHSPVPMGPGGTSRIRGLWHAHAGWLFVPNEVDSARWCKDLTQDADIAFVTRHIAFWSVLTFALPAAVGWAVTGTIWGAFLAALWGGAVRVAVLHHVTWSTNSLCHTFGTRPFDNNDRSTNFSPLALLDFGEAWHNAHHAFPRSARHGVDPGQIDLSAEVIRLFEHLGWASNVHWPRPSSLEKRRTGVFN